MNKDQKLLAEAYKNILKEANLKAMSPKERDAYEAELDKKESYKNYLAGHNNESDSLDSTVDLEAIADFLNQNNVWSGAPAKGSGGWFVHNSEVVNDDAEGGHSGISIRIVPEKNGLVFHNKLRDSNNYIKTLISWPVHAKDVEGYMQRRSAELWGEEDAESEVPKFVSDIKRQYSHMHPKFGDVFCFRLVASNDVIAFSTSDARLKEDITPLGNSLSKLDDINAYTFTWVPSTVSTRVPRTGKDIGLIAQEVNAILPEVVNIDSEGYYGVDYTRVVPYLVSCIKELKLEIENLKNEVQQLSK